jgi:SAM-dependent methyltransferase
VTEADGFYAADQAWIHDVRFGDVARAAAALLIARLQAAGLNEGTVVELGCGSGISAELLVQAGYDVVGVDISAAMVELASARVPSARFQVGSLWDADLPAGVVAVTAVGEACNYATDPQAGLAQLRTLFQRVAEALAPGGVLLFDISTPGRFGPTRVRDVFHEHDTWVLHMYGTEADDGSTLTRDITIFREDPGHPGVWRRSDELHKLVLYRSDDVRAALAEAGFTADEQADYGVVSPSVPPGGWRTFVAAVGHV